jgi:thiosulfate/3-mercaptopyruvate sulfurtransferase
MYTTIISADELHGLLAVEALVLLDCRFSLADPAAGRTSFETAHIPGAHYADLEQDLSAARVPGQTGRHPLPDPERLAARLREWGVGPSSQVVAYDDAGGSIAARAWWLARWLGHDAVAVLDGGFEAWASAGYPVTGEVTKSRHGDFRHRLRNELLAEAGEVDRMRQSERDRVFDARSEERFRGEIEPIDPVAGHIPGASCLPFSENLEQGRFRSVGALRDRFQKALREISPDRAVVYCGSGVTACHDILAAAHAGFDGMKLYAGSWSEWINDPERPIARGD